MLEMVISLVFAVIAFVISIRSFMEKGFLFNNAYLFASKEERKKMNKKPYYRQTSIVFCLLGAIFLLIAIAALSEAEWVYYIVFALAFIAIVYAVASSIKEIKKAAKDK